MAVLTTAARARAWMCNCRHLVKCGAPAGSVIVMTESGFLTDAAFDEFVEELAKGIRALPVISDHPTWWVLITMDGFHAHKMTLKGMSVLVSHRSASPCSFVFFCVFFLAGTAVLKCKAYACARPALFGHGTNVCGGGLC